MHIILQILQKRKFSLVIILGLGIFFPVSLEAKQIATDTIETIDVIEEPGIYTASFDFSAQTNAESRAHIVPARFYFTATESEQMYTPSIGTEAYDAWQDSYPTASWSNKILITPTESYDLVLQTSQIRADSTTSLTPGSFITGRILATTSFDLVVNTFSDSSTLFLASDTTKTISLTQDLKSFAMIQSKSRIYFFWIENSLIKTTTTVDGTNFTASTTVNVTDLDASIGLAGCTVKSGVDEYIALTYAKSSTEINILTFKDGSYPASTTQPISLSTISSRKVAISQNPRTEKVILTWISGNTGYYRVYDFTAPGSYNPPAGSVAIDSGFEIFYGVSCEGYNNFENSFVLPTTDNLKCYPLRSTIATHDILSPAGYAVQFPFKENNRYYAGLVSYAYGDYEFYSRELKFPAEGRWNKDTKTLHLQGPPQLNSKVKVEYEFAEVATSSCLTSIINTNGAMSAFNGQTGVIVNASNIFTVKFDTNMYPASYVSYLDNSPTSKIRLLASNSSQIDLNIVSSTTTEISFSPATDLLFNNSYSITIASDVIDWRGNQIWEPITLTFTTQNTSSNVLASEVKHITVYSDNSYSVAKIIASDGEAIGKEASNTATVYLRVEAVDPALNTIDTATVSILLNGAQIALTTLTQASATSTFFDGSFALSGPLATDSIYTFKAHPDSATSTSVVVTYPTFLPAYPASGAIGIEAKPTITIDASEELLGSSISSTTIKLLLNGIQIIATPTYVVGSKLISMTPAADLESEKTYTVSVSGLSDAYYNSQIKALSYQFTIADIAKPEVATYSPSTGELGVTIDRHVIIDFSEPLLASTVTKSTVKLTRGGIAASYSIILSGSQIRIDPDDAPDGGLRPQTTYTFEIIDTVTDPSGNSLIATFSSFTTQPYSTPPTAISSITLYKNDSLTTEWGLYEKIPASATVYVKVNGTDGATQTQDLATATLSFSWGAAAAKFSLTETASNSTGIYKGNFNLGSLPLYGFPTTLASTSIGSLTFSVDLAPANAATLTVTFPALVAGETFVNNISGQVIASNASNVRVDTPLTLTFSDELFDGGNPTSLAISSGAVSIAGTRTLSADRRKIVFQPDNPLPFSSKITTSAIYAANGLKSMQGNPIYRAVNFIFITQASQTQPVSISQLNLFPDASYDPATVYSTNDDFLRSGNMYIEVRGTDASPNTIDFTIASISTGVNLRLDETSANSGVYRGIYSYSNLTDGFSFKVSSTVDPTVNQTLLLTIPKLTPQTPASASSNVSINTSVEVKASEDIASTTVNSSNVKLFKDSVGGAEIAGTVSYRVSEKEIVFVPSSTLATNTLYVYRVSNIKDLAGNTITSNLTVSFTTQAATIAPLPPIDYLKVYADNAYSNELFDLDSVKPGSQVFVEIKANDESTGTIDSTLVEQSSNSSANIQATLIETGLNTGIFKGTLTIFNEEGAQIRITSLTDTTASLTLQTYFIPRIDKLIPASGTENIVYLNQEFTITTTKEVNPLTLSTSTIQLSDSQGLASYTLSMTNSTTIMINSELQPNSLIVLKIATELEDTDGLAFPATTAKYTSIAQQFTSFETYEDAGYANVLANDAEVETGQTIYLRLIGTDTRAIETEYATATLKSSLPDSEISLTESSAGYFTGSFTAPNLSNEAIAVIPENRNDLARTLMVLPTFTLLSSSPANNANTIPIDTWPTLDFSRPLLASTVTKSTVKLTRGGIAASYSIILSGSQIRIDPDDAPDGGLRPQTTYTLEISNAVTDPSGNPLSAALSSSFTTQPYSTPPTAISNITLYKDNLLTTSWGLYEKVPASATVYLKVIGIDGATQTQDLATATLSLSWSAATAKISLTETASDSAMLSGSDAIYRGSFNLGSLPLYGFPTPLASTSIGSLTFSVDLAPANAATLTVTFPALVPGETFVNNISGQIIASNASNVRIDTPLTLTFSDELFDGGNPTSLAISSGAVSIAGTRTLSADRRKIVFQPDNPLPFSSTITTSAIYAANGLKSMQGNPIYRVVNFNFTTQASQTQPVSISQLNLFRDASYDPATVYSTNDDFLRSGNMYIEARGTDMSPNTIDVTMASIDTLGSLRLDETSVNSGIYRGIYNYSNLADGFSFNVSATVDPTVNQTLLLTIPKLTPQTPATGSSNVSIYTSIEVKASEDLASATVNSSNVKLFKDDVGGAEIVGTVSYRVSEKEIVFVPSSALATDTLYVYRVSNIKDLAGNTITSNLTVSFTTQAATIAPLPPIDYLKIYADNAYSNELSNLDSIQPGSQVFVEIKANDESTGTIDSTLVEQSSNSSANIQATLIETGLNTGIFKGSLTIFNEEGAQILITSLTDTTASLTLQTYFMPRIDKFKPTSGAENIVYLNQEFTITTTKNVNPLTLSTSTIQLSDSHGPASYTLSMLDSTTIKLSSELQPNSSIVLTITTDLKDTDGLAFPDTTASYTSITQQYTFFGTYKDADYANALTNDATVEVGQTIYLRLIGTDTRTIETEYATATLKSSLPDSEISLTESSAGSFTGSFIVPTLSNETISMIPESRNDLARTLKVLPPFTLLSFSPASGAIAVPADTWPTWNFSRPVRDSDVTAANFSLKRINGATTNVDGDLSISTTGLQVRFQPKTLMSLLTQYEMSVAATIEDTSGNLLGEAFKTNFTTQPPPLPPSENITLANYETSDYATKTLAVAKNDSLYLELVAKDTSFSTYETTRVRVDSSDGSLDGLELALTEIAPPSGIYHLAMPINLAPGVTITVQSQGNSAIKLTITAYDRTTLQIPASGSLNLFLDSPIQLNFSHSIDRNTVAAGISLLASDARPIELRFAYADSDRSISITPDVSYASATRHQLQISTNLRDTNGLFLLPDTTWLTTRSESSATFDLLTGIATRSGQNVSQIKEATPGQLVLVATTTNMFETYSETRNLQIQTASTTDIVALSESAPGSFQGEFNLPAATEGDITATLLFAHQPTLIFRLAPLPEVVSLDPASGSSDVAELPVISATFSRKLAVESTADALRIVTEQGNIITQATNPAVDSNSFSWRPLSPLPLQSTCTLQLEDITDYLGQTLTPYRHNFTTGGRQGITIFSDNNFAQLIATDQIEIPLIFVEVAASGTTGLSGQIFDLYARAGTRASTTVKLQLEPFSNESGRFRCSLEFEPGKAVPQYPLSLLPGEWLELTSPQLTDDRKILYYRHSGSAPPVSILGIKLFSEKHFAQLATDYIANPSLFIEVEAEDLNWFTTDTTKVRVYSDADQTGMVLDMIENGTHSSQFRNFIKLTRDNTDLTTQNLKTLPDQRVYIESVTDPAVRTSITYLPENTIKMMAVYPSPARGSNVNFRFYLNFPTYVDLKIYDTSGHEIFSTGIRGQEGENVYEWRFPRKTANGTYFYAIKIDNESGFPDAKRRVRGKFAILR